MVKLFEVFLGQGFEIHKLVAFCADAEITGFYKFIAVFIKFNFCSDGIYRFVT